MQTTLGVDVLGVVQPGAVQAVAATRNGRVGYMATEATVHSGAYEKAIAAADPFVTVVGVACPELVPLIERGSPFDEQIVDAVRHYTRPLRDAEVDTVILGCTHYPLIGPMLQRMLGRGVEIVSSGTAIARQVEHVLGSRGLGNPSSVRGRVPVPDVGRPRGAARVGHPLPATSARPGRARRAAVRAGRGAAMTSVRARSGGRAADELRPVTIEPGFVRTATGSALISCGGTRVICTASVQESVPRWMAGRGTRLDDRRVRDAARVDGRAQAARHLQGQAGRPRDRDPAADRAQPARRRRPRGARASARSTSTATCSRPTAAPAAPRSRAATWRWRSPCAGCRSTGLIKRAAR